MTNSGERVFLSAGEASGDHYGAHLIAALRRSLPTASFTGLGGREMEAAGQQRVVRSEDVAVMGITEILRHIPRIYASYRRLVGSIRRDRPDVAVLIDFPDVNFRLAKHLKRAGVPVIWLVSPQLWAWKRQRLRWVQKRVTRMMVIFPFEEAFYRARGVEAEFIGHPLTESTMPESSRESFAREHGLHAGRHWVALLPGSRWKEIAANLPELIGMAYRFPLGCEYVLPVASTIRSDELQEFLATQREFWRKASAGSAPEPVIRLLPDARSALHHARASVVASGTATVLAAVIGNPFVVVYRVSALTFGLAKRLVRYPPEMAAPLDEAGNLPIAMVNLLAGYRVVPELLQERFTAANVARELEPLLADGPERDRQVSGLAEVRQNLRGRPGESPIERVAAAVLDLLAREVAR